MVHLTSFAIIVVHRFTVNRYLLFYCVHRFTCAIIRHTR
nr:MAG TPA: hypothetical protein [Bacteriophage sp.]